MWRFVLFLPFCGVFQNANLNLWTLNYRMSYKTRTSETTQVLPVGKTLPDRLRGMVELIKSRGLPYPTDCLTCAAFDHEKDILFTASAVFDIQHDDSVGYWFCAACERKITYRRPYKEIMIQIGKYEATLCHGCYTSGVDICKYTFMVKNVCQCKKCLVKVQTLALCLRRLLPSRDVRKLIVKYARDGATPRKIVPYIEPRYNPFIGYHV